MAADVAQKMYVLWGYAMPSSGPTGYKKPKLDSHDKQSEIDTQEARKSNSPEKQRL